MNNIKSKIEKFIFIALLALSFAFFTHDYGKFQNMPAHWGNPSEMSRLYSAVSLIETGHFSFDNVFSPDGALKWQAPYDYALSPMNGRTYSDKPPLTVLLAVPVYAVWKTILLIAHQPPAYYPMILWARFWLATVPFLLSLFILFKILRKDFDEPAAWLVLFIFAFGTINASFASLFLSHSITGLLVLLSLYFTLNKENRFLAGLFAGLAVISEFTAVMFAAILFIYLIVRDIKDKKPSNIGTFALGALPSLLLLLGYDWAVWGSPFRLGYEFVPQMGMGDKALYHISIGQILQVLFGPARGIFFYSPALAFAIAGIVRMFRDKKPEAWLVTGVAMAYLLFLFGYREWESGWSPGIRHFIGALPLLALPLAYELKNLAKRTTLYKVAFYSALFLSVVLNVLPKMGYVFYPENISNPIFWAGAYYVWQKIMLVNYGNFKPLAGLIAYAALFAGMSMLFLRKRAEVKFTKEAAISIGIAAVLFTGILALPQTYDTEDFTNFYALANDMPNTFGYYRLFYVTLPHRVRTEFASNQAYADSLFLNVQRMNAVEYQLDSLDQSISWMSIQEYDNPGSYTKQLILAQQLKVETENYLIVHEKEKDLDPALEADVRAKMNEYAESVLTVGDKEKASEMYEFLFYAYMLDKNWSLEWQSLQKYMMLKENWW